MSCTLVSEREAFRVQIFKLIVDCIVSIPYSKGARLAPIFYQLDSSKKIVVYSKISLHFHKDYGIFCEGEWKQIIKNDGKKVGKAIINADAVKLTVVGLVGCNLAFSSNLAFGLNLTFGLIMALGLILAFGCNLATVKMLHRLKILRNCIFLTPVLVGDDRNVARINAWM